MRVIRAGVVWLDGSRRPGKPIRRRWRLRIAGRTVLSVPLRTVPWSRRRDLDRYRGRGVL